MNDSRITLLKRFLSIYGWLSLVLFSGLLLGFAIQAPALDAGGRWHWLIWGPITDPVPPMLLAVYVVWSIYIIRAARDPMANKLFIEFTAWANVAHGIAMVPHALMAPEYHTKFLTDIPWVLLPLIALWLMRPTSNSRQSA